MEEDDDDSDSDVSSAITIDADDDLCVHYGPKKLHGNGFGTVTSAQRKIILEVTQCSAAVRHRLQWGGRRLTIYGPAEGLRQAKAMAIGYIMESQMHKISEDTEGAEGDPLCSKKDKPKKTKAEKRKQKRLNRKARERKKMRKRN